LKAATASGAPLSPSIRNRWILLVAGDASGGSQTLLYRQLFSGFRSNEKPESRKASAIDRRSNRIIAEWLPEREECIEPSCRDGGLSSHDHAVHCQSMRSAS
jgi:hypothetical protein